jgi:hypothetical protein
MTTPPTEHDQPPMGTTPDTEVIPTRPSMHPGGPAPGPGGTGRDAPGPEDQVASLLAADDDQDFVRRVFQDFGERLDELGCRIVVVVEDGHLDAGRRRALFNRILDSSQFLIDVAGALEPEPDWYAR